MPRAMEQALNHEIFRPRRKEVGQGLPAFHFSPLVWPAQGFSMRNAALIHDGACQGPEGMI